MYKRTQLGELVKRMGEPRGMIQVIAGPRHSFVVGSGGVPVEEFLLGNLNELFV